MDFSELKLHPDLKKGLDEVGYVTCTPVQEMVFDHAFKGEDIYAQSQTGTGKTAAFLVSIFQRIMTDESQRNRKVLILSPTRELAVQIEGEAERLGKYLPITAGAFYGGVSYGPQVDMLRSNVQMIIGTPGRIQDLVNQGKMLLKDVGFLVIDEADRMFDMGFIDDLRKLIRYLPPTGQRQTFLFSATLGLRVKDLAWEYMDRPHEVAIEPEHVTVDLVTQELYHVGNHEKFSLLLGILDRERPDSALIFCNQKFMVEEIARRLKVNGVDCEFIMGDLPQAKRLEVIERLKAGEIKILVATDVAARGLDVEALDLVVNYDLPDEAESYVHRIGRTARAGKAGKAVSFACEKFVYNLMAIERLLGSKIPVMPFDTALLLQDRSSGMRFGHTRDYDRGRGPHEGRGGRPGDRRPAPRGSPRGGERRRPADDRGGARTQRPERVPARTPERAGTEGRPASGRGDNPYAQTQDERLRGYKERYGQGERQEGQAPSGRSGGGRGKDRRPAEGAAQGGRQAGGRAPSGRQGPGGQQGRGQGQGQRGQGQQQRKPAAAAPAKPGLLARIKGLFKRG
ncbi:MAG TPA: DEAD/DEAH box helicase [Spirochaetales bacterium]|nr:DEAD/DEAH box helicase [Spirochaetales bacterium]HRY54651.1 DEAD/DEAH box helicase [Spirochaetia bacterium]HRZ65635.1 DEAD/DEAH box helicase [Spirochaetia bacterium]